MAHSMENNMAAVSAVKMLRCLFSLEILDGTIEVALWLLLEQLDWALLIFTAGLRQADGCGTNNVYCVTDTTYKFCFVSGSTTTYVPTSSTLSCSSSHSEPEEQTWRQPFSFPNHRLKFAEPSSKITH
ncbi:hypothetical protein NQ318_017581 [Aromia moschata]|uniref:Uncharacterized protein n=1 Tax=Aromia moschata TaxID=1265417 RepID=A0AAV8Z0Z4_9CUCU|nr:hypothetical protein NQ318_017581 [Aromia moschata]